LPATTNITSPSATLCQSTVGLRGAIHSRNRALDDDRSGHQLHDRERHFASS
jgi:hypothetical protein